MPNARTLELSEEERSYLETVRDTHDKAHLQEKATALIKIADGMLINQVGREGLHKCRAWITVQHWLNTYEEERVAGLHVAAGRGRNPIEQL